jgi:hypothetical protein
MRLLWSTNKPVNFDGKIFRLERELRRHLDEHHVLEGTTTNA